MYSHNRIKPNCSWDCIEMRRGFWQYRPSAIQQILPVVFSFFCITVFFLNAWKHLQIMKKFSFDFLSTNLQQQQNVKVGCWYNTGPQLLLSKFCGWMIFSAWKVDQKWNYNLCTIFYGEPVQYTNITFWLKQQVFTSIDVLQTPFLHLLWMHPFTKVSPCVP